MRYKRKQEDVTRKRKGAAWAGKVAWVFIILGIIIGGAISSAGFQVAAEGDVVAGLIGIIMFGIPGLIIALGGFAIAALFSLIQLMLRGKRAFSWITFLCNVGLIIADIYILTNFEVLVG